MKKILRPIILSLVLILPGAIFIFLKFFGTNQYELPVFKASDYPELFTGCPLVPLGDRLGEILPSNREDSAGTVRTTTKVIVFASQESGFGELQNQIRRVAEDFSNTSDLDIVLLSELPFDTENQILRNVSRQPNSPNIYSVNLGAKQLQQLAACTLLLPIDVGASDISLNISRLVLVDKENRVRGFYVISREDIDRLIIEINILSSNDNPQ